MIGIMTNDLKKEKWAILLEDISVGFFASICIALFAPCAIFLPFTLVPIAIQGHVVLFLAFLIGSRRAMLSVFFFLVQGALNYPVFAGGGFGIFHLLGPKGGYLFGYFIAAYFVGSQREVFKNFTQKKIFSIVLLGNILIYISGVFWLSGYIGFIKSILLGVVPFLIGDFIKLIIITKLLNLWLSCQGERGNYQVL